LQVGAGSPILVAFRVKESLFDSVEECSRRGSLRKEKRKTLLWPPRAALTGKILEKASTRSMDLNQYEKKAFRPAPESMP
jgi:hypothetical protein